MSHAEILLWAGLSVLVYMTVIWVLSVLKRDTSIVDIFWGAGFVLASLVYFVLSDGWMLRKALVLALVAVWGLRLSIHIAVRNHGTGEDKRYRAMREKRPSVWWWRSFFTVFLLQGVLLWIISLPLLSAQSSAAPPAWQIWDLLGVALWSVGFFFEAVADWQLLRFKRNPSNKGKVMSSGLWRYSRHPNYFGETVIWWGFFLLALSSGQYWVIVSPIIITVLLLKFSGVTMLEKDLKDSKAGYREYIQNTNAFFPWLPKSDNPLQVVDHVDLEQFMGDWYVVANIPTIVEKGATNAIESYRLKDDSTVGITFSYDKDKPGGQRKRHDATGYIVDSSTNARWRVQFFWPVKFPFLVIHVDDDYRNTIIGYPGRTYLWIMSRDANPTPSEYERLIGIAVDHGYDRDKIKNVRQEWSHAAAAD